MTNPDKDNLVLNSLNDYNEKCCKNVGNILFVNI